MKNLKIGSVSLELATRDDRFRGFGEIVTADGVRLRNGAIPAVVKVDTAEGVVYPDMRIAAIRETATGTAIELELTGYQTLRMEYQDDYEAQQIPLHHAAWPAGLTIELEPDAERVGTHEFTGFRYRFRIASERAEFHRLLAAFTWEPGGSVEGVTLYAQNQCSAPVWKGRCADYYTSACLNRLGDYGDVTNMSFQLGTRGALVQRFDLLHGPQGVLWGSFADPTESVCSLYDSTRGENEFNIYDEYRFESTHVYCTGWKRILFCPGEFDETAQANLWYALHEREYGALRAAFGVAPTRVRPTAVGSYSSRFAGAAAIEIPGAGWKIEHVSGNAEEGGLQIHVLGESIEPAQLLALYAEKLIPLLDRQRVTRFEPAIVISESDVTRLGYKRKLEMGVHGDLICASVCATHRFFPSEFWGGMAGWKKLYAAAHSRGIELWHWFAPHYSPRTPYYKEHPEYRCIGPRTQPTAGGYSFQVLAPADWNSGIYQETLRDLTEWHEQGGLDGVFLDSFPNLGAFNVNYRNRMKPNYPMLGKLLHDLQRIGIKGFSFESMQFCGLAQWGLPDLRGNLTAEKGAVPGQSDFDWWFGHEDMFKDITCEVGSTGSDRTDADWEQSSFRTFGGGGLMRPSHLQREDYSIPDWRIAQQKIFNRVAAHMTGERTLCAGRAGALWRDGNVGILWSYADDCLPLPPNAKLTEIVPDGEIPATRIRAYRVYAIR